MDVNEYIESGVLEAYILGTATEAERLEVERMANTHEAVRTELDAIETMLLQLGQAQAVTPPVHLQQAIWDTLQNENISAPSYKTPETPVVKMDTQRPTTSNTNMYRMAAVSIGILCAGSIALNLYLNSKVQSMSNNMTAITQRQDSITRQMAHNLFVKDSLAHQLSMASNPDMKMVHLMGRPMSPSSHVMLYWDTKSKDVYVHIDQLPPPANGMQYQLWAIVDGKPVDAGMITKGDMVKMKAMDGNVQAFAITLEKAGGSPSPTMEQMYVLGKV